MNDQNQENSNQNTTGPVETPMVQTGQNIVTTEKKIPFLSRLYSNKLIFWSVGIFLIIALLIVILGLLFGRRGNSVVTLPKPTKVPFILPTPDATPRSETLSTSQQKIDTLRKQLEELDVRQKRLQPPNLDFDIKF